MPSILRHVRSRRMLRRVGPLSRRTIPALVPGLLETREARLQPCDVVANRLDVVAKTVDFVAAGNRAALLLEIFAQVLPERRPGTAAPVGDGARQVPEP